MTPKNIVVPNCSSEIKRTINFNDWTICSSRGETVCCRDVASSIWRHQKRMINRIRELVFLRNGVYVGTLADNWDNIKGGSSACIFESCVKSNSESLSISWIRCKCFSCLTYPQPRSLVSFPRLPHFIQLRHRIALGGAKFAFHRDSFAVKDNQLPMIDPAIISQSNNPNKFENEHSNFNILRLPVTGGVLLIIGIYGIGWGWWSARWRWRYRPSSQIRFIAGLLALACGIVFLFLAFWALGW